MIKCHQDDEIKGLQLQNLFGSLISEVLQDKSWPVE